MKEEQKENLYRSVMDIIVRANGERFKVDGMCEALEELMKDRIEELERQAEERGMNRGMVALVEKKLVKGKSFTQIVEELEGTEESIRPIYESVCVKMNVKPV